MITFTAGLIGLLGLVLAGGGAYLAYLGGSLYFLIAGAAFLLAAIWIARRQSRGLWLFALALVGTYLWALWESGYSWWPLASRVGLPSAAWRAQARRNGGNIIHKPKSEGRPCARSACWWGWRLCLPLAAS